MQTSTGRQGVQGQPGRCRSRPWGLRDCTTETSRHPAPTCTLRTLPKVLKGCVSLTSNSFVRGFGEVGGKSEGGPIIYKQNLGGLGSMDDDFKVF